MEKTRLAEPDLLLLVIEKRLPGGEMLLSYRAKTRDPNLGPVFAAFDAEPFRRDPHSYLEDLFRDIEDLSREITNERLASLGVQLFEQLMPLELRRELWKLHRSIQTVQIISDEAWIPWELLKLHDPDDNGAAGPFFVEAFALTRWLSGHRTVASLPLRRLALVIPPDTDQPSLDAERRSLKSLESAGRKIVEIPACYRDVIDALASGYHDAWHFAGHGLALGENPDRWSLELGAGQRLTPTDLRGEARQMGRSRPLVVVNACHSGRGAVSFTGLGGFASAFLKAGAGAFVGAHWALGDERAHYFARAFYERLLANVAIGEAIRQARLDLREQFPGTPDWLAYTAFAHPLMRCEEVSELAASLSDPRQESAALATQLAEPLSVASPTPAPMGPSCQPQISSADVLSGVEPAGPASLGLENNAGKEEERQRKGRHNTPKGVQLKQGVEEFEDRVAPLSRPTFRNPQMEQLSNQLEELYTLREYLAINGEGTHTLDSEILDLRRLLRKGPQLQPGEFLLAGRYRLVETLGQGGFATVWKAYDRQRRELVAVKVLHGQHSEDRTRRERFFRGARKMAELIHNNIVRVLEPELEDDGWLFFAMELLAGGDFGKAVLVDKLTEDEKLAIVSQVGEALEFAHKRGVIHRDVKPANVLLDGNGVAKLTDFDLVRVENSTGFTHTRAMLGTLNYAAPEVLASPKEAGPAADVYSLASTAVFALSGAPLPQGYYRDPGPAIASLTCAPDLTRVLTRATAADPEQRFASAGAFVAALKEVTVVAEDPGIEKRPTRKRSQRKDELFSSVRTPQGELTPLWCEIPAGIVWIGSPDSEKGRQDHEGPRYQVEIVRPFWLASVPVTNAQYAVFDPKKPFYRWQGVPEDQLKSHPRVYVTRDEATSFCDWLADRGFQGARLPTEEEWEYACRAGSETAYWSGDGEEALARVGWYDGNAGKRTHRVGGKEPNPWALYDIHGNVWEWTYSVWDGSEYEGRPRDKPKAVDPAAQSAEPATPSGVPIVRGGSYWDSAVEARAANRNVRNPEYGDRHQGFRVLLPFAPS